MKNSFGSSITVTLFGESHGDCVGCVLDGLRPGMRVDKSTVEHCLSFRRPAGDISTARRERDDFSIVSGVYGGVTTGAPVCVIIPNEDVRSGDYAQMRTVARPSHADYSAFVRYNGHNDTRGGGRFSGRLTAALVAAGAILLPTLNEKGIFIGTHIKRLCGVTDRDFMDIDADVSRLYGLSFPVLDDLAAEAMRECIKSARADGDSVGGTLETAVVGLRAGLGEPFFDSVEGLLAPVLFAVPGIKGVEFGAGFALADMRGSESNDPFRIENGVVVTSKNDSGGVNGGITNGMPVVFRCAVRPTPTISKEQETVDFVKGENVTLAAAGRHDPCIVHRARAVVDCVAATVVADLLAGRNEL